MRAVAWLVMALLIVLGLGLGLLTLGAFASLNAGAPLALRSLGTLSATLSQGLGLESLAPLYRALALTLLTSLTLALAAFIKPRA